MKSNAPDGVYDTPSGALLYIYPIIQSARLFPCNSAALSQNGLYTKGLSMHSLLHCICIGFRPRGSRRRDTSALSTPELQHIRFY